MTWTGLVTSSLASCRDTTGLTAYRPIVPVITPWSCLLTTLRWTELTWPAQVDRVTRRVHWLRASASTLYFALIGCSETGTVNGARPVINTCIPMRPFRMEFANWQFTSVQSVGCAARVSQPLGVDFVFVCFVFTARCCASVVLVVGLCLSVCPSQDGVLSKRVNESSWFWHVSFLPPVLHCFKRQFGYLQK